MKKWIFAVATLVAIAAQAQTLSGVKVEPAAAKVGEPVKITVSFEPNETPNCGLRIHFGDGQVEKVKINKASEMPYIITRSYPAAGQYKVDIEPTTAGSTLKCLGKRQAVMLAVVAPASVAAAPVAAAPAPAAKSASAPAMAARPAALCPEGWALVKPGQNAKTKAFTCSAKAGTIIPEPKVACPGDLTYFDNSKKGQLGCRI